MRLPALDKILKADVELLGRVQFPPRLQHIEPGQALTSQEIRHIARRQPKLTIDELHQSP
ncbi:MAG: hypothetical protein ACLPUO_30020 [Streptosporangiaceae bacterium]